MRLRSEALGTAVSAGFSCAGDGSSVPRKSAWAVCDNGLFAATNFLVAVAVARNVSQEEYGTFALAQSIVLLVSIFHTAFLTEPVLVFGSERYRERAGEYVSAAVWVHLGMFVVLEVVLAVTVLALFKLGLAMWARAFFLAAVGSPFILLGWFLRKACYIKKAPEIACAAGMIYIAAVTPCIWILTKTGTMSALWAFVVMGLAAIPASVWILVRLHAPFRLPQPGPFLSDMLRQHARYGRWALGAGAMRWVPFNVPLMAMASSASASYAGALRALMTILMPGVQFFQAVNTMLVPFCAGRSRAKVAHMVTTAAVSETLLAIAYSAAMGFLSRPLLHTLYAGKYDFYAPYLTPLSLLLAGEALAGVISSALRALELPRKVFAACLGGALLTFLGITYLRPFAMKEAVWLIVAGYAATAVLLGISLSRVLAERGVACLKTGEEPCA
jgi:O-antigen/teichoic acid export membrane protein